MNRILKLSMIVLVIGVGFSLGLLASNYYEAMTNLGRQSGVTFFGSSGACVAADTSVTTETAYMRCRHIISAEYAGRENLTGKKLQDIKRLFSEKDGFLVWFAEDGTLVIHRRLEDWCPVDKNKVHLGVVKNHVAMFRGPGNINDEIIRITNIQIEVLPENLRRDLKAGIFEFTDEDEANFVLENLDEYE